MPSYIHHFAVRSEPFSLKGSAYWKESQIKRDIFVNILTHCTAYDAERPLKYFDMLLDPKLMHGLKAVPKEFISSDSTLLC